MKQTLFEISRELSENENKHDRFKKQAILEIEDGNLDKAKTLIEQAINIKKSINHIKSYKFEIDWSGRE